VLAEDIIADTDLPNFAGRNDLARFRAPASQRVGDGRAMSRANGGLLRSVR